MLSTFISTNLSKQFQVCIQPNKFQDYRELWKLPSSSLDEFKDQTLHRRDKNFSCRNTIHFTNPTTTTISKNHQASKFLWISPKHKNTFQHSFCNLNFFDQQHKLSWRLHFVVCLAVFQLNLAPRTMNASWNQP